MFGKGSEKSPTVKPTRWFERLPSPLAWAGFEKRNKARTASEKRMTAFRVAWATRWVKGVFILAYLRELVTAQCAAIHHDALGGDVTRSR